MVTTRSDKSSSERSKGPATKGRHAVPSQHTQKAKVSKTPPSSAAFVRDATETLNKLLAKLSSAESTICPSQIPRAMNREDPRRYQDWRGMMQPTRELVWDHVKHGRVEVTQGGEVRHYESRHDLKGPLRVRRGPKWSYPE